MHRITPRTCLWPLTGAIVASFALSIGLTFRSDHYCYAGVCGEWLFPLQTRIHIIFWYSWLSISVRHPAAHTSGVALSSNTSKKITVLAIRAFSPPMRAVLCRPLVQRKVPLLGTQLALSSTLVALWIAILYGAIVSIWWNRLETYFQHRGQQGGVFEGNNRLAAIALTGHLADVTMGMVLIPVSRHSALSSFFKLSTSTTLVFHMMMAYVLCVLVLAHILIYIVWVPVFSGLSTDLRKVFPVLNPTYLQHEVWPGETSSLGIWRASLIFTGTLTTLIMSIVVVTALPQIRRTHFNLFYFTHLLTLIAVIVVCLHASTMFYCLAPGLAMWVLDWGMRLYELGEKLPGKVSGRSARSSLFYVSLSADA
jgi:hypothetical protein